MTPNLIRPVPLLTLRDETGDTLIASSRQWPRKRHDILRRVEPLLGAMPDVVPPPDPQVLHQEDRGDYLLQRVRYHVQYGETCPGWLLLPKPLSHRQPAVLCCHGAVAQGKDEPAGRQGAAQLAFGPELVKRGFVVLAPDSLTAGERVRPGEEPLQTRGFYANHPHSSLLGRMLWDHQRGLDFLCHLDAVDSDRLGVMGHGLGGLNAILLAAFDHRIKATAASCAYEPLAADEDPGRWCREGGPCLLPALAPILEGREPLPFDWVEVLALVAPRAFHVHYALADEVFPHGEAVREDMIALARVYDLLGCRDKFSSAESADGHTISAAHRRAAYALFKRVLLDGR